MNARTRSRGLARVNRLTGWLAGGAVVVSAAFVALFAHPQANSGAAGTTPTSAPTSPGVTAPADTAPSATNAPPTTGDSTTTLDPYNGSFSNGGAAVASPQLNPPVQLPRSSSRPSQVSSGGS